MQPDRRSMLLACVASCVSGCSLLVAVDDDLTGGAADASIGVALDGAPGSPDGGPHDADLTPALPDGGGAPPFCPSQGPTVLCEDFDVRDLGAAFASQSVKGGTLARTTAFSASPAHAMEVRLMAQADPNGDATAVGSFVFDGGSALVGELKVRIDERTPLGDNERFSELMTFDYPRGNAFWQIGMRVVSTTSGSALELFQFDSVTAATVILGDRAVIPDQQWTTLRLTVDVAARTAEVRRIDTSGSPVLASGTMSPPGTPTFPVRWKMNVGLYAYGVQTGWRAQFDDVLVRSP